MYLVFNSRYSAKVNGDRRNVMYITPEEAAEQGISFKIEFKMVAKVEAPEPDGQASGYRVQLKTTARTFESLDAAMAYRDRYGSPDSPLTEVLL
jgi:hypothetical protein